MRKKYTRLAAALLAFGTFNVSAQYVSSFETFNLGAESVKNGSGPSVNAVFSSGNVEFPNTYQTDYAYWSHGWCYSTMQNDSTEGYQNMYSAYTKGGNNASAKYAVGQQNSMLRLTGSDAGKVVKGLYITNGTYAALSMKKGDAVAKKFGGPSGNDPDFFVVTIKKFFNGVEGTDSVNCYLADFRSDNNADDYILDVWKWVDLTTLGNADSLWFQLHSSDVGQFGMNTPAFFCVDDVITGNDTADFENLPLGMNKFWNKRNTTLRNVFVEHFARYPNGYSVSDFGDYWNSGFAVSSMTDTITAGYANLYSCYAGKGADTSDSYAVVQNRSFMNIEHYVSTGGSGSVLEGMYITNTTYAALSMKNGDAFGKKFGGDTGNDSDYFRLTIKGYKKSDNHIVDSVITYLADYRFADNSKDYILKDWKWVDLRALKNADSLVFTLTSSDVGQFGMNTPGFFAIDDVTLEIIGGLGDPDSKRAVNMYPNPAQHTVTIEAGEDAKVSIMDMNGKIVLESIIGLGGTTIHIEALNPGMYIARIETGKGVAAKKLWKQ